MSRLIDADTFKEHMDYVCNAGGWLQPVTSAVIEYVKKNIDAEKTVDAIPVVRCKDCKYYELDSMANVNGIPLIVAHNICKFWGRGCKTDENGFCFMGEKVTE